uniref:Uncharacterized protein n=1 Tax=uncultured bacterium esnapd7 TaxID=1366614 RepID=S5UAY5_9BACT|nr:hypothetical protein [uncultured bacterium esnapd7]
MFELTDAVLCADGPVRSVAELSLAGEHRRGHGSGYAALARGHVDAGRLRLALSAEHQTIGLPHDTTSTPPLGSVRRNADRGV